MTDRLDDADDGLADVIPLPGRMPQDGRNLMAELPLTKVLPHTAECWHRFTQLDVQERRIYCRDCKVELDPITVLASIADRHESITRLLTWRRRDLDQTIKDLAEAERLERNAKARLRTVRRRALELADQGAQFTDEEALELFGRGQHGERLRIEGRPISGPLRSA